MSTEFKDTVQVIFEIVMVLASVGVLIALFKNVFTKVKNALLYFRNLETRLKALESKKKRKTKK